MNQPDKLRIATWNFLSGGSARRSTHWTMLRRRLRADILLTQECKPVIARANTIRTALWSEAARRRWGTALVARDHAIRKLHVPRYKGWVEGGEVEDVTFTGRPVRVFSIHCPAGDHGYIRTMHDILDRLARHARVADLVLGGDFNVAVGFRGPDEAVRMSRAERVLLERMTDELNLMPCWQTLHPDRPLAQTLRWTGNRAAPYHCDGIFAPRSWRAHLQSCTIINGPEWHALSDHNPVVAVFASASSGSTQP